MIIRSNAVVTSANQVDAAGAAAPILRGSALDRALLCKDGGLPTS